MFDLPGMWEEADFTGGQDDQAEADARINRIIANAIQVVPAPPPLEAVDVRTAIQEAIKKLERTVYCAPEIEEKVRQALGVNQIGHVTVVGNPYLPEDKVFIVPTRLLDVDPEEAFRPYRTVTDFEPVIEYPDHAVRIVDV